MLVALTPAGQHDDDAVVALAAWSLRTSSIVEPVGLGPILVPMNSDRPPTRLHLVIFVWIRRNRSAGPRRGVDVPVHLEVEGRARLPVGPEGPLAGEDFAALPRVRAISLAVAARLVRSATRTPAESGLAATWGNRIWT